MTDALVKEKKKAAEKSPPRKSFMLDDDTALRMRVHIERLYREVDVEHTLDELILALSANYIDPTLLMLNDHVWIRDCIAKQMKSDSLTKKAKQFLHDELVSEQALAIEKAFAAGREEMISANEAKILAQLKAIQQRLGMTNE